MHGLFLLYRFNEFGMLDLPSVLEADTLEAAKLKYRDEVGLPTMPDDYIILVAYNIGNGCVIKHDNVQVPYNFLQRLGAA